MALTTFGAKLQMCIRDSEDTASYYEASNSTCNKLEMRRIKRNLLSVFDFEGYQVVRGQFMAAHAECPSISITGTRITFNIYCVRKFNTVPYIQLLLHPSERKLAIRPCDANDIHSIRWRPEDVYKRQEYRPAASV